MFKVRAFVLIAMLFATNSHAIKFSCAALVAGAGQVIGELFGPIFTKKPKPAAEEKPNKFFVAHPDGWRDDGPQPNTHAYRLFVRPDVVAGTVAYLPENFKLGNRPERVLIYFTGIQAAPEKFAPLHAGMREQWHALGEQDNTLVLSIALGQRLLGVPGNEAPGSFFISPQEVWQCILPLLVSEFKADPALPNFGIPIIQTFGLSAGALSAAHLANNPPANISIDAALLGALPALFEKKVADVPDEIRAAPDGYTADLALRAQVLNMGFFVIATNNPHWKLLNPLTLMESRGFSRRVRWYVESPGLDVFTYGPAHELMAKMAHEQEVPFVLRQTVGRHAGPYDLQAIVLHLAGRLQPSQIVAPGEHPQIIP